MANRNESDKWNELNRIVVDWVESHVMLNIDDNLANWLDDSGSLLRQYQVVKWQ